MLLRFRVANHRSIREEQELSLVAVPKRGEPKPKGDALPPTVRVAGIYGANASGKSNVLDALRWMQRAVSDSHTRWRPEGGFPRRPFRLDDTSRSSPSFYEVDFVHRGERHTYGFEVTDDEVTGEWLFAYPNGRARRLFERSGHGKEDYRFGRSLTGEVRRIQRLTRANALYLSTAASNDHPTLLRVYRSLTQGMTYAAHDFDDERHRLRVIKILLQEKNLPALVDHLVRVADLGISRVTLERTPIPDEDFEQISRAIKAFETDSGTAESLLSDTRKDLETRLTLSHSADGRPRKLDLDEESDGTRVWLSLAGQMLHTIITGGVFLVDEIDSSLHPMLSSTLIRIFKDPETNPKQAQLVFASHDTTLLGSMLESDLLRRDEVWFTEKDRSGATALYSLADFHPRGAENTERGYLQGRYGAVPFVDFDDIRSMFIDLHRGADDPSPEGEEGSLPAQAAP
ncbi:ATP-binding protein [Nocardiopsis sp. CNT-189]|uniref:AAA family ATPase n=1 Tax=Nocardiopsis oceanisediminis TaxID=2816862 RepID=UPI003B30CA8C